MKTTAEALAKIYTNALSSTWDDLTLEGQEARITSMQIALDHLTASEVPSVEELMSVYQKCHTSVRGILEAVRLACIAPLAAKVKVLEERLESAKSLVIKHHESGYHCANGMFCPVCSPDGKDGPWDEVFALYPPAELPQVPEIPQHPVDKWVQTKTAEGSWSLPERYTPFHEAITAPEYRIVPTFEQNGKTWLEHKPGDEMPVGPDAEVAIIQRNKETEVSRASGFIWSFDDSDFDIIGYYPTSLSAALGNDKPRPETFEAHGLVWKKHVPGDPMPCDGFAEIWTLLRERGVWPHGRPVQARLVRWNDAEKAGDGTPDRDVIGWRIADEQTQPSAPAEPSEVEKLRERVKELEKSLDDVMKERDENEEWADKLAESVMNGAQGEHSNMNHPWQNAISHAEGLTEQITKLESRLQALTPRPVSVKPTREDGNAGGWVLWFYSSGWSGTGQWDNFEDGDEGERAIHWLPGNLAKLCPELVKVETPEEKERRAFEEWWTECEGRPVRLKKSHEGHYLNGIVHAAWAAWQARAGKEGA